MRKTVWVISISLTSILTCFTITADAVIPQLLGPLTALMSIVPQILAFVGVAIITSLVFARDTTKLVFYKIRNFFSLKRVTTLLISLVVLIGIAVLTYQIVVRTVNNSTPTVVEKDGNRGDTNAITGTPWTTFRFNADRTGHADTLPGPQNENIAWIFKEKGLKTVQFLSSPAVVGNRLYIAAAVGAVFSTSGATYCIDIDTQNVIWRHDSDIPIFSSPAVVAGRVYVGEGFHYDDNCSLMCLDAKTGDPIWSFKTKSHVESTPFITQGRLYFTAGADGVYCLDALAGEEIWHYPAVHADMAPLVKDGKVFFGTGYDDYLIIAADADTGDEIWSRRMPYPVWGSPSAYEDIVFFGLGKGNFSESAPIPKGRAVAVNANTGDTVWEYEVGDAIMSAMVVYNEHVIFGSRDGHVYSLTAKEGTEHWKKYLGGVVVSSPAVAQDTIYAATASSKIFSLSFFDGSINWEYDSDAVKYGLMFYSSPAIVNGKLYIGSSDRYIFCLGGSNTIPTVEDR